MVYSYIKMVYLTVMMLWISWIVDYSWHWFVAIYVVPDDDMVFSSQNCVVIFVQYEMPWLIVSSSTHYPNRRNTIAIWSIHVVLELISYLQIIGKSYDGEVIFACIEYWNNYFLCSTLTLFLQQYYHWHFFFLLSFLL